MVHPIPSSHHLPPKHSTSISTKRATSKRLVQRKLVEYLELFPLFISGGVGWGIFWMWKRTKDRERRVEDGCIIAIVYCIDSHIPIAFGISSLKDPAFRPRCVQVEIRLGRDHYTALSFPTMLNDSPPSAPLPHQGHPASRKYHLPVLITLFIHLSHRDVNQFKSCRPETVTHMDWRYIDTYIVYRHIDLLPKATLPGTHFHGFHITQ